MYDYDNDKAFFYGVSGLQPRPQGFSLKKMGGAPHSREFWIGVCREGSWTLTLFKD